MNIKQVAMGAKPDPLNYSLVDVEYVNGNTIILARYHGCKTYDGLKLMLLTGRHELKANQPLDPHFLNDDYPVIARFVPNGDGHRLAQICARSV